MTDDPPYNHDYSFEEPPEVAGSNPETSDTGAPPETSAVQLGDFVAYMPQHSYIITPTGDMWASASVNARIPPVLVGNKTISASTWIDTHAPVEQMTWAPGEPQLIRDRLLKDGGWFNRHGATVFNLYRPPTIIPKAGDVAPWLGHLHRVFPDAASHIATWLAQRVQHPHDKINHALVLGGEQGVGKDTILEPVKRAIGPWNFDEVGPRQILGRFNGFLKSVILRVSEVRDLGETDRFTFYDHLKAYTAAPPDVLRVDEKNRHEYAIPNVTGIILTTNYKAAICAEIACGRGMREVCGDAGMPRMGSRRLQLIINQYLRFCMTLFQRGLSSFLLRLGLTGATLTAGEEITRSRTRCSGLPMLTDTKSQFPELPVAGLSAPCTASGLRPEVPAPAAADPHASATVIAIAGRPSGYSPDLASQICAEVAAGASMREVCAAPGMPSMKTVFRWLSVQPDFQRIYAIACAARADAIAEEMLEIADDGRNDWIVRLRKNGSTETVVDNEAVQRSRLRIDTRKWLLSKLSPKKYGDVTVITGAEGAPLIPPQPPTILETARALAWILTKAAHDQEQAAKQDHLEDSR